MLAAAFIWLKLFLSFVRIDRRRKGLAVMGSTSVPPQFISSTGNRSSSNAPLIETPDTDQIVVPDVSNIRFSLFFSVLNSSWALNLFNGFRMFASTSFIIRWFWARIRNWISLVGHKLFVSMPLSSHITYFCQISGRLRHRIQNCLSWNSAGFTGRHF